MKGNAKPSLYFSAYPLKAVEATTSKEKTGSPYLKAILSAKPKQPVTRARVFPMVNPYKNPYGANLDPVRARLTPVNKVPGDIELTEKKWFHNYE
jgi:hypothetical protein